MPSKSHQQIRASMLERIQSGEWGLGELIPGEVELAKEYDCARTTVNRALQALADQGLLKRKRKGGTRIIDMPVRCAKLEIPIIREEIQATGHAYQHRLLQMKARTPPTSVRAKLRLADTTQALYSETLHLADTRPYAHETRWLNKAALPEIEHAKLDEISLNEWLVQTIPFSNGDVAFSAINAPKHIAAAMDIKEDCALFQVERTTWIGETFITTVKTVYHAGFQRYSEL